MDTFGETVKAFRKRRSFTQQDLASKLDVHRNTIVAWEQGNNLPKTRGQVLELAKALRLSEQETDQLLQAGLSGPLPKWNVPYARNSFFTGREEILENLHKGLGGGGQVVAVIQSYALQGLGGIGKTHLAVEYTYRYRTEYDSIMWIAAENVENILSSFVELADLLQLPERQEADQQKIVVGVQRWLSTHNQWLMVWDNVEDLGLLQRFLPTSRQGAILITTRRQALGTLARGIEVPTMTPEEGLLFLLRRAKVIDPQATKEQLNQLSRSMSREYRAAQQLVAAMDGLPLALDQAGAYIEETPCSLTDYLELFQTREAELLNWRGETVGEHPASVVATWSLSFEKVEQANARAADLLRLCAFLHPDAIPEELLMQGIISLDEQPRALDRFQLHEAIRTVSAYSLVRCQVEERTCSMHRLVQAVLRDGMDAERARQWMRRAALIVNAVFPEVEHKTWGQCERLVPHALVCANHSDLWEPGDPELTSLLLKTATYLYQRGQYDEAECLFQRAGHIFERTLGPEHPSVAYSLNSLAQLYADQGKYGQAEPLFQRSRHIFEQVLGPEHPDVAAPLNGLANLYRLLGKYEEAEALCQLAWRTREQALGPEHPDVAAPLYCLATIYNQLGKYEEAEALFQRVVHIFEQALGPEHPEVAAPLNNLATLYDELGKYEEAEALLQRVLCIREQALGSEHPDIAAPLNNLAQLYVDRGKYDEAEPLYKRARRVMEQTLGREHPNVAIPLNNLADLYRMQGKHEEAEALYKRALHIWEQALGPEYLNLAYPLSGLGDIYSVQGKHEEAEALYKRALRIWEQTLGPEHPQVAYALNGLAKLYSEQKKYDEAEALFRRAIALREHSLEAQHPYIADSLHDFATCLQAQGKRDEAIALYQRALVIREHVFGTDHSKTLQTRESYIYLVQERESQEETPASSQLLEQQQTRRTPGTRAVTFTCQYCQQTVTQQRAPGPIPHYCSDTCRDEVRRQKTLVRVRRLRKQRNQSRD